MTWRHIPNERSLQDKAAACCEAICKTAITGADGWKIGRTKIFLKVLFVYNMTINSSCLLRDCSAADLHLSIGCRDGSCVVSSFLLVFQDAHDAVLERLRELELSRSVSTIRRTLLAHKDR